MKINWPNRNLLWLLLAIWCTEQHFNRTSAVCSQWTLDTPLMPMNSAIYWEIHLSFHFCCKIRNALNWIELHWIEGFMWLSQVASRLHYNMVFCAVFRRISTIWRTKFRRCKRRKGNRASGRKLCHWCCCCRRCCCRCVESITEFMCKFNCLIAFVLITRQPFQEAINSGETHFNDNRTEWNGRAHRLTTVQLFRMKWPKLMANICTYGKLLKYFELCVECILYSADYYLRQISQEVLTCCHLVLINLKLEQNRKCTFFCIIRCICVYESADYGNSSHTVHLRFEWYGSNGVETKISLLQINLIYFIDFAQFDLRRDCAWNKTTLPTRPNYTIVNLSFKRENQPAEQPN